MKTIALTDHQLDILDKMLSLAIQTCDAHNEESFRELHQDITEQIA